VPRAAGTIEREQYASALAGVWEGLSATLARLEAIAADPASLEASAERLPALQYGLHRTSELVRGIEPPPGAERAHADLEAALESARDATGEIREAVEAEGGEAALALVHEWRGALFGVRLARHRLTLSAPAFDAPPEPPERFERGAALAAALVVAGTAAFTTGALLVLWPVWALGVALVAASFLVIRF